MNEDTSKAIKSIIKYHKQRKEILQDLIDILYDANGTGSGAEDVCKYIYKGFRRSWMTKIFCRIGLHRPLKISHCQFIDTVTHKEVFEAYCPCGKRWLTDNIFGWFAIQSDNIK